MLLHLHIKSVQFVQFDSTTVAAFLSIRSGEFDFSISSAYCQLSTAFFDQVVHIPIIDGRDPSTQVTIVASLFLKSGVFEEKGSCSFLCPPSEHGKTKKMQLFSIKSFSEGIVELSSRFYHNPLSSGVGDREKFIQSDNQMKKEINFLISRRKNWGGNRASSWKSRHESLLESAGVESSESKKVLMSSSEPNLKKKDNMLSTSGKPKLRKTCMSVGYVTFWPSNDENMNTEDKILLKLHLAEQRRLTLLKNVEENARNRNATHKKKSDAAIVSKPRHDLEQLRQLLHGKDEELRHLRKQISETSAASAIRKSKFKADAFGKPPLKNVVIQYTKNIGKDVVNSFKYSKLKTAKRRKLKKKEKSRKKLNRVKSRVDLFKPSRMSVRRELNNTLDQKPLVDSYPKRPASMRYTPGNQSFKSITKDLKVISKVNQSHKNNGAKAIENLKQRVKHLLEDDSSSVCSTSSDLESDSDSDVIVSHSKTLPISSSLKLNPRQEFISINPQLPIDDIIKVDQKQDERAPDIPISDDVVQRNSQIPIIERGKMEFKNDKAENKGDTIPTKLSLRSLKHEVIQKHYRIPVSEATTFSFNFKKKKKNIVEPVTPSKRLLVSANKSLTSSSEEKRELMLSTSKSKLPLSSFLRLMSADYREPSEDAIYNHFLTECFGIDNPNANYNSTIAELLDSPEAGGVLGRNSYNEDYNLDVLNTFDEQHTKDVSDIEGLQPSRNSEYNQKKNNEYPIGASEQSLTDSLKIPDVDKSIVKEEPDQLDDANVAISRLENRISSYMQKLSNTSVLKTSDSEINQSVTKSDV